MPSSYSRLHTIRDIAGHPLNRERPVRALMRYLGWNIGRRLVDLEYVMPLAGDAKVVLSNHENYATLAYTEQLWDYSEMLFLLHLLRPGDLFVDIGSNVGGYTVLASAVAGARSIAVEPVPSTYAKLLRNLRLNGIEDSVEAINIGLADRPASLRFTETLGGLNHVIAAGQSRGGVEVQVRTLDCVLSARAPVMMKLDVEGYEMQVLRGAERCLARPELMALIVELNGSGIRYGHSDEQVHQVLLAHGFAPHDYDPGSRVLAPRQSFNTDGLNTLYCRRGDEAIPRRVIEAPKVRVRDREI
jgi:FkbM family methyltransferase